jgi:hypothetical protein
MAGQSITSRFLGTGWRFNLGDGDDVGIGTDKSGRIALLHDEESVRQSIWLILSTAPGERVARPDFGCGIHRLVFATQNAGTIGEVTQAVDEALVRWEPRIDVLSVQAQADSMEQSLLLIDIEYQIRATNSRFNLVYPFYLT